MSHPLCDSERVWDKRGLHDFSEEATNEYNDLQYLKHFTIKGRFQNVLRGGGRTHGKGDFWGYGGHLLISGLAAHWSTELLVHLGILLHVIDVFLNPGIAGIGTEMPALFGEKAVQRVEGLYRA